MAQQMQNVEPLREIFDQMFSLLEALETQNIAVLQFLRNEGIAGDEKLAPYLERAATASSVKWRAARARMEHLLTPIPAAAKEAAKQTAETHKPQAETNERKDGSSGRKASPNDKDLNANTGMAQPAESKSDPANKHEATGKKVDAESAAQPEDGASEQADTKNHKREHA